MIPLSLIDFIGYCPAATKTVVNVLKNYRIQHKHGQTECINETKIARFF